MQIDTGHAQIDGNLLAALLAEGVREADARELSRLDVFGQQAVPPWMSGLRAGAMLLNREPVILDWSTLPDPWARIGPSLNHNGSDPAQVLMDSSAIWGTEVQAALLGAVAAVATRLAATAATKPTTHSATQPDVMGLKMAPIDPILARRIQAILERKGSKEQRRKAAGEQLLDWLFDQGEFIRTIYGAYHYLYRAKHRLFALDSSAWQTWLYLLSQCNPAGINAKYLGEDCKAAAEHHGQQKDVVRLAHWDQEQDVLRVSQFDGTVLRLDGETIEIEANGDGPVLFEDASYWVPFAPDFSANGQKLAWSVAGLPTWDGDGEDKSLLYLTWILAMFFTELCPTRPIMVMKGEKGSGKSMLLRVLLRLLFGPTVDVVGVPEKADDFASMASNSHLVCMDNMDDIIKGIRDKLASLSTGKLDQVRKLYTTNETQTIRYRCWLAVTSRTPDTLQRDDLVDRVLILPLRRIEDKDRERESKFLKEVMDSRNQWWGDMLSALNSVVREIRRGGLPDRGGFRMEDWAALGSVIARARGQEDIWEKGLQEVKVRQSEFLLEDDVTLTALEAWLSSSQYTNTALYTRNLYEGLRTALFGVNRPDASWPRSVKSFGRRLAGMQRELQAHLAKSGVRMSWGISQENIYYQFEK